MGESALKEKTARGLFWGGLSNVLLQLLNLCFGIFLARLLSPGEYGMVGMLSIFTMLATALQESGFTAVLINEKEIVQKDYSAVFWFNIFVGLFIYLILYFSAPLIASFFHQPELTPLARYLFLGFVFTSFGTVPGTVLSKQLKIKQKSISGILALFTSGTVSVVMAYKGCSYWGIATQTVVSTFVLSLCFWVFSGWKPSAIDLRPIRKLFPFGIKMLITNLFDAVGKNVATLLLGKLYTKQDVGYYNQAGKWSNMGSSLVTGMVSLLAQPVFVEASSADERQLRVLRKIVRFTALVTFPVLLGIGFIAPEFIVITITAKWSDSIGLLKVLCVAGMFLPFITLFNNLIVARGRAGLYMWVNIASSCLTVLCMVLLSGKGIYPMAICFAAIHLVWASVLFFAVRKEINYSLGMLARDIAPFFISLVAAILVAHLVSGLVSNIVLILILKVSVTALFYLLILKVFKVDELDECFDFISKKFLGKIDSTKE